MQMKKLAGTRLSVRDPLKIKVEIESRGLVSCVKTDLTEANRGNRGGGKIPVSATIF